MSQGGRGGSGEGGQGGRVGQAGLVGQAIGAPTLARSAATRGSSSPSIS